MVKVDTNFKWFKTRKAIAETMLKPVKPVKKNPKKTIAEDGWPPVRTATTTS